MLKLGARIFTKGTFVNEAEIEAVVRDNADYIFGPASIFLPKALIRTAVGIGTIPDGFVVDLAAKKWYIVEAELAVHDLWRHIAPQITKQMIASTQANARNDIANMVVNEAKNDKAVMEKFSDAKIDPIHVFQFTRQILDTSPEIAIPIDEVSDDLKGWATTSVKAAVKLWEIHKYVEFGNKSNILYQFPDEFKPVFDTGAQTGGTNGSPTQYDVTVKDLLKAGLLQADQPLTMSYKPEGGARKNFTAIVQSDGSFTVMDQMFTSPSYAAIYCIQSAGSPRKTTNGWTSWKDSKGNLLSKLRNQYIKTMSAANG